ncbi:MAG: response regulator [bacterium]
MPKEQRKRKILIIDDDNFLINLYIKKFQDSGFEVFTALAGEKGIELAKKHCPDIIILDVLLPEMDGYDVLKELKRNSITASIPVVMLTNFFQKEDIDKFLKLDIKDYLIKSHFMPSEVVAKVEKALGKY